MNMFEVAESFGRVGSGGFEKSVRSKGGRKICQ